MPTISIIIPVYNSERYLRQCIESVIAQTFEDWEAILVNDGSKDGSLAICQEYAAKDKRIKVIDKPNGGVSSARNKGLEIAQGDWITFMDSDDWLDADAFEVYYEAAQRTGADIVKTGYRWVRSNNVIYYPEFTIQDEVISKDKSDILVLLQKTEYHTFVCNMMVTSLIAKKLRFDESTPWLEDQFFGYECLLRAGKITLLPKMVYNYRTHENGSLSTVSNPFHIAYSGRKDIEYKLRICNKKHTDFINQGWNTYHIWQAHAIDMLYRNGYSYEERKLFYKKYAPIDGKCVYVDEIKFFRGIFPFWLRDLIERLKRYVKGTLVNISKKK